MSHCRVTGFLVPTMNKPKQIDRTLPGPTESLCDHCTAKCCRYFALPIDTPQTFADFEYLRWYLMHDRASIFVEEDTWYLLVHTVCKHLQGDNRCGIYESRPQICREYSTDDCEFDDRYTYDRYFETSEQVAEYADALFANKPNHPNFRSARPGLPIIYAMPE
jgi:Fe-S-cluster containining protein